MKSLVFCKVTDCRVRKNCGLLCLLSGYKLNTLIGEYCKVKCRNKLHQEKMVLI